ncbi:galactose-binding lectin l-1-like [Littorina saxatilis]
MDARFNFTTHVRKLIFNSYVGGVWGSGMTQDAFPFNNGQPFEMEFRLLTWDTMEIYVNSTLTASYTAPVSLASISYFFCSGDAFTGSELQLVDVWSGCDN